MKRQRSALACTVWLLIVMVVEWGVGPTRTLATGLKAALATQHH